MMDPDPNGRRRSDPMRWRRDLAAVAALLIALVGVGWTLVEKDNNDESDEIRALIERVDEEAEKARNGAIQNCRDLRVVEYSLIAAEQDGIRDDRALPASFFSDIPKAEFQRLIREGIKQAHKTIRELRPSKTCDERFDR